MLILNWYGPEIDYIQVKKKIVADAPSILPNNINKKTTHESNCIKENIS